MNLRFRKLNKNLILYCVIKHNRKVTPNYIANYRKQFIQNWILILHVGTLLKNITWESINIQICILICYLLLSMFKEIPLLSTTLQLKCTYTVNIRPKVEAEPNMADEHTTFSILVVIFYSGITYSLFFHTPVFMSQ